VARTVRKHNEKNRSRKEMNTIRKIVIEYVLSEAVHLKSLFGPYIRSVQLISSGSSFEPLLIIPSSTVVLN
jgi:hypothetical protein